VTILERIRGDRRPAQFGRIAKDLMNRDMNALGRDAAGVLDQVKDIRIAAADAIEHFQSMAADAADRAGEALEHVGDEAGKTTRDVGKATRDAGKATREASIDAVKGTGDDIAEKLRKALPTERISQLVENLERELPTTDKGRYDRAYSRGWARARTSFIVVGAATGIAAGIVGALLLDPRNGARRRAALRTRVQSTTQGVGATVSRTASMASDKARAIAVDRGLIKPDAATRDVAGTPAAASPLVPVMDIPSANGFDAAPVMPMGTGPVTDPSSIEREPADMPAGGLVGGVAAGDAVNVEDDAIAAGDDADRGTWHRTI
jgi:gas vesicle protein